MTIHSSTFAFIHSSSSLPLWLVGQKFESVAYAGLFGGVMVGFGGILYTLYTEMSETSGSYALVERAVKRVESDQRLMRKLGAGPLKIYGQSNRYGRRRPQVISRFLEDGTRCYDTNFWIEGDSKNDLRALVTLQVVTDASDNGKKDNPFKERFLSVEFLDKKTGVIGRGERIILIQPSMNASSSKFNWNPFSKFF